MLDSIAMHSMASQQRAGRAVRCVLLLPPGEPAWSSPEDLREALVRRGLTPIPARGMYDAMAALCLGDRSAPAALIVVEPKLSLPRDAADRLSAAIAKHVGTVTVWRYEATSEPRLRAEERITAPAPAPGADTAAATRADPAAPAVKRPPMRAPALRLAPAAFDDEPTPHPGPHAEPQRHAARPAPSPRAADLLSEQELSMLLGDDPAWHDGNEPGNPGSGR